MPLLTSACPGWVCYAEKTQGDFVLPYISAVKSPQQMMGMLTKYGPHLDAAGATAAAGSTALPPNKVYHVAVMPCYDKKLEASREDFYSDVFQTRDVDCVITTGELETMMQDRGVTEWGELPEVAVDTLAPGLDSTAGAAVHGGGGSGGYLEYVFRRAARELFGVEDAAIEYESRRNPDFREVKLTVDGDVKLRFASAYGMKSIQTVMRQVKRGTCKFHFIEIMACPKGCNNGGGQLVAVEGVDEQSHFDSVERAYASPRAHSAHCAILPLKKRMPKCGRSVGRVAMLDDLIPVLDVFAGTRQIAQ
jgi:iron only hydrogenase large subunit-like protein